MNAAFSGVIFSSQLKIQDKHISSTETNLNRPTRLHVVEPICHRRIYANEAFYISISSVDQLIDDVESMHMEHNSYPYKEEILSLI